MAFEMKKKKKNLDASLGMARSEKKQSSWALGVSLWKISGSNSIFSIKKKDYRSILWSTTNQKFPSSPEV